MRIRDRKYWWGLGEYKVIELPCKKILCFRIPEETSCDEASYEELRHFQGRLMMRFENMDHYKQYESADYDHFYQDERFRYFWVKEELKALRYAIIGMQEALWYASPHSQETFEDYVNLGKKIKGHA